MFADRKGTRLIGLAMMWTGIHVLDHSASPRASRCCSCSRVWPGLDRARFTPSARWARARRSGDLKRNIAMSLYVTGGTLGVASGPLIGAILFHFFGLHGTAAMIIPGTLICFWMFAEMKTPGHAATPQARHAASICPRFRDAAGSLIIGLMMLRSWTMSSLQAFIPTLVPRISATQPRSTACSPPRCCFRARSAPVGSGTLADKHGRQNHHAHLIGRNRAGRAALRPVPRLVRLRVGHPDRLAGRLHRTAAARDGATIDARPGRSGIGLILGFGFIMGAIGIPVVGAIGDRLRSAKPRSGFRPSSHASHLPLLEFAHRTPND